LWAENEVGMRRWYTVLFIRMIIRKGHYVGDEEEIIGHLSTPQARQNERLGGRFVPGSNCADGWE
jgi:hypothetical protein